MPSEKAFAYKMKLEAMKHQGWRSDLTSDQVGRKLETAEMIAEQSDDSKTQIRRYIRLTYLIPEFLEQMDEGKIAFSVGVELSYLNEQIQYDVLEQCEMNDCTTISLNRAATSSVNFPNLTGSTVSPATTKPTSARLKMRTPPFSIPSFHRS